MNLLRKGMFVLLGLGITVACSDDDDAPITDPGNGGGGSAITNVDFTLTASADTRTGTVTPSSDGGTLYTVDFGDASTEDDVIQTSGPAVSYTYPATTATYTISVTASASGADDVTVTKDHTVTVADVADPAPFAGTWNIKSVAGAIGVGPAKGDISWWSLDEAGVTDRACYLDDEFVFGADGSFAVNLGDATWLEGWQGAEEGCGAPVYPHDGSATDYTFDYDESAQTITVNGIGAYVGLAKVYNEGELTSTSEANGIESITYNIVEISEDGNTMTLDIQFQVDGGYWTYILQKSGSDNGGGNNGGGSESALVGSWSVAPEAGGIGVGPAQGDISWWSLDDAGVTDRACYLDDEFVFGADGSFSVSLGDATWLEGWQGAEEGCGTPVFPHDGSATDYTYTHDDAAGTITVNGIGAYIGLAKVYNDGELASTSEANGIESITYSIVEMADGRMTLDINFGPGYWTYILVKN